MFSKLAPSQIQFHRIYKGIIDVKNLFFIAKQYCWISRPDPDPDGQVRARSTCITFIRRVATAPCNVPGLFSVSSANVVARPIEPRSVMKTTTTTTIRHARRSELWVPLCRGRGHIWMQSLSCGPFVRCVDEGAERCFYGDARCCCHFFFFFLLFVWHRRTGWARCSPILIYCFAIVDAVRRVIQLALRWVTLVFEVQRFFEFFSRVGIFPFVYRNLLEMVENWQQI